MRSIKKIAALAGALTLMVAAGGMAVEAKQGKSSRLPLGSEPVNLNPAAFTTRIDNPYWPMRPGTRWIYREADRERDHGPGRA